MHASSAMSSIIAGAILLSRSVSGGLAAIPRAITESALDPWITIDASGSPIATITPVLTTVNGVETTLSAAPPSLTATTTSTQGDKKPTPTSGTEVPTSSGGGSALTCHNRDGDFAPFCMPNNGSEIWVGETYYVTWDRTYLSEANVSISIQGDYVNATGGGPQAFNTGFIQNTVGLASITIDKEWLKGQSSNNITLYFFSLTAAINEDNRIRGPTLMVTNRPTEVYHQEPAKAPKGKDLYIALPTVFGFILLCLVGGFFWNRKHRKIGLGNVMGRKTGYGTGKSKAQRMGTGKKKAAAIQLREQELTAGGQYKDVPPKAEAVFKGHARADSDALGSLAGSPTREGTNYFRDEIKRQESTFDFRH